jgi:parallel beta-helix repeat protein
MTEPSGIQMRRFRIPAIAAVLAASGVLVAVVLSAGQAEASHVNCGDTITADATLDTDLLDCPNNGIVIGADDVRLDLNGHTVSGDDALIAGCANDEFCDTGILNDGHRGVTIAGGAVRQFGTGVFIGRASRNAVDGIDASHNALNGLLIAESTRSAVTGSSVSANGLDKDFPGIAVFGSSGIKIKGTTSVRNADLGLFVTESNGNRFVGNDLSDNPEAGAIIEGDRNEVRGNRVARNGDGIVLSGDRNTIARNEIVNSRGCGEECGIGISLEDGRDNLIERNEVRRSRDIGIRLLTFVGSQRLRDNVVRRNRVRGAGHHGLLVGPAAKQTQLDGNRVSRASNDGIHVQSRATRLLRNRATRNGDLGIAATEGVTDGGGNSASGNGNAAQCTNVKCD